MKQIELIGLWVSLFPHNNRLSEMNTVTDLQQDQTQRRSLSEYVGLGIELGM